MTILTVCKTVADLFFDNGTTTLEVPEGQSIELRDDAFMPPGRLTVKLMARARLTYKGLFCVAEGRFERVLEIVVAGHQAQAFAVMTSQTQGDGQCFITTQQRHTASATASFVRIHGVSDERSRATVLSSIRIEPGLAGVEARQVHKHLLLSDKARVISEPSLEILSDDVSCSHGAAIAHLDLLQLFYLQARGYSPNEARDAIIKAFLAV